MLPLPWFVMSVLPPCTVHFCGLSMLLLLLLVVVALVSHVHKAAPAMHR